VEKMFQGTEATILNILRERQPISRAGIAQVSGISKPAVSEIVGRLIAKGVIAESETGCSTCRGGKKPRLLSFCADFRTIIAIDIGGTNIRTALSDLDGVFLKRVDGSTRSVRSKAGLIALITESIHALGDLTPDRTVGIGIGLPGTVDPGSGMIQYIPSFDLRQITISEELVKTFGWPVFLANDVTLNALGELWKGEARGTKNLLLVSLGTGTGSGIILNGQVYEGAHGYAGEIGYQVTDWSNDGSGKRNSAFGSLENWFSGYHLEERLKKMGRKRSMEAFFEEAESDTELSDLLRDSIEHLALAISNAIVMFDPESVILTGGIGYHQYDRILRMMRPVLQQTVPEEILKQIVFRKGVLGKDGVLIGAVSYVQGKVIMCMSS